MSLEVFKNHLEMIFKKEYGYESLGFMFCGDEEKGNVELVIYFRKYEVREKEILKNIFKKIYKEGHANIEWTENSLKIKQPAITDTNKEKDVDIFLDELSKIRLQKFTKSMGWFKKEYDFYGLFHLLGKQARLRILTYNFIFSGTILNSLLATQNKELITGVLKDLRVSDLRIMFDTLYPYCQFREHPRRLFNILSLTLLAVGIVALELSLLSLVTPLVLPVLFISSGISFLTGFVLEKIRKYWENSFINKYIPYLENQEDDDALLRVNLTFARKLRKENAIYKQHVQICHLNDELNNKKNTTPDCNADSNSERMVSQPVVHSQIYTNEDQIMETPNTAKLRVH